MLPATASDATAAAASDSAGALGAAAGGGADGEMVFGAVYEYRDMAGRPRLIGSTDMQVGNGGCVCRGGVDEPP